MWKKFNKRIISWLQLTVLQKVLRQLPLRKIAPPHKPNGNPFPNSNPITNRGGGQFSSGVNCPDTVTEQLNKEHLNNYFQR